jgi:hypothetical protein
MRGLDDPARRTDCNDDCQSGRLRGDQACVASWLAIGRGRPGGAPRRPMGCKLHRPRHRPLARAHGIPGRPGRWAIPAVSCSSCCPIGHDNPISRCRRCHHPARSSSPRSPRRRITLSWPAAAASGQGATANGSSDCLILRRPGFLYSSLASMNPSAAITVEKCRSNSGPSQSST